MKLTLEKFLFDIPIYTKIEINESNVAEFDCLIFHSARRDIEGYNSMRKVQSTFSIIRQLSYSNNHYKSEGGHGSVYIQCKRYDDIFRYYCLWNPHSSILMKIGQFPSVADIHIGEIKQYSKLLPKENLREFTRAIGLAANGVGIGSFVYLRRIFEFLINQAFEQGIREESVNSADFQKARMDGKIEMLKKYLPEFLVENKSMYSILSLGVHELDENTCLANFDTLRIGIEIILDEHLETLKKREKIEIAQKKLQVLKGKVK